MDMQSKVQDMQTFVQCEKIVDRSMLREQERACVTLTQSVSNCPICGEEATISLRTDGVIFFSHCSHCDSDYAGVEETQLTNNLMVEQMLVSGSAAETLVSR